MSRARINSTTSQRKNLLINGNFDVWQRNTTQTSSGYGSADRWISQHSGSTKTASRQSFSPGTDVLGEPQYFHRTVVTTAGTAGCYTMLTQNIEGVRSTAGRTVTLSFWAKADTTRNIAVEYYISYGTGGSPTPIISGHGVKKITITSSWAQYTATTTLPSLVGKTLGTDMNDAVSLSLWLDGGSNFNARTDSLGAQSGTFDFANVQLEYGNVATEFEYRTYEEELELCQRYYQKSYAQSVFPGAVSTVGIEYTGRIPYVGSNTYTASLHKKMRTTPPTITFYSPDTGTASRCRGSDGTDYTVTSTNPGAGRISFNWTTTTANLVYYFHWTADAEV